MRCRRMKMVPWIACFSAWYGRLFDSLNCCCCSEFFCPCIDYLIMDICVIFMWCFPLYFHEAWSSRKKAKTQVSPVLFRSLPRIDHDKISTGTLKVSCQMSDWIQTLKRPKLTTYAPISSLLLLDPNSFSENFLPSN